MDNPRAARPYYVHDEARPEWRAEFSDFYKAFHAAAKLPRGEVFHRMGRIAGRCADCEEFESSRDWRGASWVGDDWLCDDCHREREDAIEGGCGGCTRASFCHCRGY